MSKVTKVIVGLLGVFLLLVFLGGCNRVGSRSMIYTEEGLRLAADEWDSVYRARLDHCEQLFPAKTPEAEECFGPYFDADAKVETVLRSSVVLLRSYWLARATGSDPDWRATMLQVDRTVRELPPEALAIFTRVRGL